MVLCLWLKSLLKEDSEKAGLKLNTEKPKIMPSSPISSWHLDGDNGNKDFIFGAKNSLWMLTAAVKLKDTCSLEEKL